MDIEQVRKANKQNSKKNELSVFFKLLNKNLDESEKEHPSSLQ